MKRFAVTGALVVSTVLVLAQPAAASWLDQPTPPPGGPGTTWQFSAVSCTAATSCVAVGTVGGSTLLSETRSGDTWTIVSIPGSGMLNGISCTSASACEAVGQGPGGTTLAERWNGSNWAIQSTPNPAGATNSLLSGVSCPSASVCEAVGQSTSGGVTKTLAERWNGSNWAIQSTPNAGGATNSVLGGVSCPSASSCEAVGDGSTGPSSVTLAEVWNGTKWTIQTTPNGPGSVNQLEGVSCTAAGACTATGDGLAERWNGTHWTLQTLASPHGDTPADLSRVSCTDKTRCMAVGTFFDQEAVEMLVTEQWNGTAWKVFAAPVNTANDSNGLADVSCPFATACTAVGFYHNPSGPNHALAEDWSLRWQLEPPQIPLGAIASGLDTVSCPSVNFCAAVGGDEQSGSVFDAIVQTWNGKAWTIGTIPNAANTSLDGVSCTGATVCTAVGDVLSGGKIVTLALRWNGTNWTVQSTPNPSGMQRNFLVSVSCPSAKSCIAVGRSLDGSGNQTQFAEHWNGTAWTIKKTPVPTGAHIPQLNGVSCTSSTACQAVGSDDTGTWAEQWNGTSWTIKNTPLPGGGRNGFLGGVSCTAANACTAVGDFVNASNKVVPLADRWNGTNWSAQSVPAPSGSISEFSSVSCRATAFSIGCNAAGFVTKNGISLPVAESWNGSTWAVKPTQSPDPNVTSSTMSSVSCSSLTTCVGVGFYETSTGVDAPLGELYN